MLYQSGSNQGRHKPLSVYRSERTECRGFVTHVSDGNAEKSRTVKESKDDQQHEAIQQRVREKVGRRVLSESRTWDHLGEGTKTGAFQGELGPWNEHMPSINGGHRETSIFGHIQNQCQKRREKTQPCPLLLPF